MFDSIGYKLFNNNVIQRSSSLSSKYKKNRDYLITDEVAGRLNTYRTFSPMVAFTDAYGRKFKVIGHSKQGEEIIEEVFDDTTGPNTTGIKSIFNKYGVVLFGDGERALNVDVTADNESAVSEWRISNNVPLMDSPTTRKRLKKNSGCTIKELVQASEAGLLGQETYSYSDFMYCKNLGKVSNNYLITLRRFPLPVDDFISSIGEGSKGSKDTSSHNMNSLGCMVTWLGASGNDMENILKYSFNMPFKEQNAEWQKIQTDYDSNNSGPLNGIAAMFDESYRKAYAQGQGGAAICDGYFGKLFPVVSKGPYNASEINAWRDQSKVYGKVDSIKSAYSRDANGLTYVQSMTLTFEYELRSYNGINGRQAMLDLLSNILNVTYTTGTFWGGGFYGGGAHQNNIFTNSKMFKARNYNEFVDAFTEDYNTLTQSVRNQLGGQDWKTIAKKVFNQVGGMILGGMLNKLGRPQKTFYNSLLSPAPSGFWHVTIGNPHHPIMSMGNMILKNTTITHTGPLGLDDFPTGLKVTCELDRGKPRDIRDIEKLYMHGNDRIFYSMGPKVEDMYKHAKEYKPSSKIETYFGDDDLITGTNGSFIETSADLKLNKNIIQRHMGGINDDMKSIIFAASEMEYGGSVKKVKQKK